MKRIALILALAMTGVANAGTLAVTIGCVRANCGKNREG